MTKCDICGTTDAPDNGWIYKASGVRPAEIEGGELRFEAKDDAKAYCSIECSREA